MIRRVLHDQTQHVLHSVMAAPTRSAVKLGKQPLKARLMQLRTMVADWSGGVAVRDEEALRPKAPKHK